jgi:acetyltransferase-like isoleucine patch superfamily enzyme
VHVCPGVTIAGHCTVGDAAWIGVGSVLKDRVTVGDRCFLGAGSNVVGDLPSGVLAYGSPARTSRPNTTYPTQR